MSDNGEIFGESIDVLIAKSTSKLAVRSWPEKLATRSRPKKLATRSWPKKLVARN